MKKIIVFVSFFLFFLSFIIFKANESLEPFKTLQSKGKEKCYLYNKTPSNFKGPEDIVNYQDFLIISATYHTKLYEKKDFNISNLKGGLYVMYPNETMEELIPLGFPPEDFKYFRPFSLSLHGNHLYALNEYYEYGNDRIEVFEIIKTPFNGLNLKFLYSITFEENFLGMFNNFFLLDKNEFLITTWHSNPDHQLGRANNPDPFALIKKYYHMFSGEKKTYVYYCISPEKGDASCIKIKNTEGRMNNGILFNKKDQLVYVANTLEKKVSIFHFKEKNQPESFLEHIKDIELPCLPDNLNYDAEKQRIIFGCIGKGIDYLRLIKGVNQDENGEVPTDQDFWFGLGAIHKNNSVETLFMDSRMYRGVAGGVRRGEKLYIGSFCESSLLVCDF